MNHVPTALAATLLLAATTARAAPPTLSFLFPPGARQGTRVTVTVGPKELGAGARLWIEGDGIAPVGEVKEGKIDLAIAKDAAPGLRRLRVITPEGASVPRPFVVGVLPEINEVEPNNTPKEAQPLTLPVTVNGQIMTRNDPDSFRVSLKAGECLVVAAQARTLGAPTDLVLRLLDPRGVEVATCEDYEDRDPLLAYVAPSGGEYTVEAYDVMTNYSSVNADYTYRLTFTTGPYLDRALALTAPRGAATAVTLHGWNLDSKPGRGTMTQTVTVPPDAARTLEVTFPGAPNSVTLFPCARPETAEAEPNNDPTHAQPVSGSVTLAATLDPRADVDLYRIEAAANERFLFTVDAESLGSPLDAVLALLDTQGKSLAQSDDSDGRRDPVLRWTAPAAGPYLLRVRDVGTPARGGPDFIYRLHIDAPHPGLSLSLTDPSPTVAAGDKLELALKLTRRDGAAGEVEVTVEGLPPGVTTGPLKVPAAPDAANGAVSTDVKLLLTAAPDAAPGSHPIHIRARTTADGRELTATALATFPLATDRSGTVASGATEQLMLIVKPKPAPKKAPEKSKG